ncbi:MAG TPA: methyltransferase, partial [Nitrosopumilaceae archaeon]|nr:methyltransferase [Nitrosopumilaceae archaeon]
LAQKSKAHIDAIDLEVRAYEQASENARFCKWSSHLTVHHISLQSYSKSGNKKYDLIVSNPPYFIQSSKSAGEERTHARHNDILPFEELVMGVIDLLEKTGRFCLILPIKEASLFRTLAESKGLYLSKLLRVRTKKDKESEKRHVMEFTFSNGVTNENTIVIEKDERHEYTEEFKELTKDYYINL